MKKTFTFTRTLTVFALLLAFTAATAASISNDDSGKCRKSCCRKHKADKETDKAMKEFTEAMRTLTTELKGIDSKEITAQVNQVIAMNQAAFARAGKTVFVFATAPKSDVADETQHINFANLDKEMDQVQEDMSQMDPTLKKQAALHQSNTDTASKLPSR